MGKTCIAITNLPPRAMMGIDSCGMLISAVHHEEGAEHGGRTLAGSLLRPKITCGSRRAGEPKRGHRHR